jgi:PHO85 cyclin-5
MHCGENDSSPYITSYRNGPYSSSIASSASSSSASVWSDASSQSSDDSSTTTDSEILDTYCSTSQPPPSFTSASTVCELPLVATYWQKQKVSADVSPPPELRQHPRRTSVGATSRTGCPPSLVRQCDRKVNFVDSLVGKPTQCNPEISALAQ